MSHLKQKANQVPVDAITNLAATEVQGALAEHQADIDALAAGGSDGVVSNVAVNGNNLDFTGTGGGFNSSVDVSTTTAVAANTAKGDYNAAAVAAVAANTAKNDYPTADSTKLAGIEANAKDDQTGAEIKASYEGEANTNAFTDAEKTKLGNIEDLFHGRFADLTALNASADPTLEGVYAYAVVAGETKQFLWDTVNSEWDQDDSATTAETAASIKTKYESNADTNALTDADLAKLANVPADQATINGDIETRTLANDGKRTYPVADENKVANLPADQGATNTTLQSNIDGKEDDLGNPAADGYVSSSTAAGVRSWVDPTVEAYRIEAGNYTIVATDSNIEATGAASTITLPAATAAGMTGKPFTIDNSSAGDITLTGAQTINGAASLTIPSNQAAKVMSNGTVWRIK